MEEDYKSVIIYPHDEGWLCFCMPAKESGLSLKTIADKDVPFGKPYLIVPSPLVPADHTFFEAFTADFSQPDGYGQDWGVGSTMKVVGWNSDGTPILEEGDEIQ